MPSPETRKGYLYGQGLVCTTFRSLLNKRHWRLATQRKRGHSAEVKERRTYGDISHVGYCFVAWIAYAGSRQKLVLHTMPLL